MQGGLDMLNLNVNTMLIGSGAGDQLNILGRFDWMLSRRKYEILWPVPRRCIIYVQL